MRSTPIGQAEPRISSNLVFGLTIFLSALLLFLLEPLAARTLLPVLGGSSSVWLACLCFFQCTLLLGYGYAFLLTTLGTARSRSIAFFHCSLLALAALSLLHLGSGLLQPIASATRHPAAAIFLALTRSVALPFFLLSTTSPLLQVWLARRSASAIPYRLFALSNVGSFLALLAYPLLLEPFLTLRTQRNLWCLAFLLYAALCASIALNTAQTSAPTPTPPPTPSDPTSPASPIQPWLWFGLAAAAAMQLCAVTGHLSENVAAIPLLWVIPLAVYLLSFVLAFEFPRLYQRGLVIRVLVVMLASLGYLLSKTDVSLPIALSILFFLVELLCACWFAHAEIHALRPSGTRAAAAFYLVIAAGGAAGTLFVAVLCPLLFRANYDLPLAFAATALMALAVTWPEGWPQRLLWGVSSVLSLALVGMLSNAYRLDAIFNARNFYGSLRVRQTNQPAQAETSRTLMHGSIKHGMQWFAPEFRHEPTTYYARDSGIGLALGLCCPDRPRRIGVIGLGAGTLASYGRPGDTIRFYEINPLVDDVARNLFSFLRESPATISIVDGDARISLAHEPPQNFDVLVVDAFSGDAIPVHLLTAEALAGFRRHLAPGGILAFHISNQYLDLRPVLATLALSAGMQSRLVDSPERPERGEFTARWILLSDTDTLFSRHDFAWAAEPVPLTPHVRLWTDNDSSLLPILRWTSGH